MSFNLEDLRGVNFDKLDGELAQDPTNAQDGNGWENSRVYIDIPSGQKVTKASKKKQAQADAAAQRQRAVGVVSSDSEGEDNAPLGRNTMRYPVSGFHHRKFKHIIEEACSSEASKTYHWHPYEEHWAPPWRDDGGQERVHGELYASKAFLDADRELQNSPREPGCDLPRVILAMMGWSDATHVAQFGQAKLWPLYFYFGNQTKYDRARPSARAAHHAAYFPSLPDEIIDFLRRNKLSTSKPMLTHCRRELFHACWKIMLDDDFLEAYEHGIVIRCGDGVTRRVYPRLFTYSADYPEKVLIATIRDIGECPCVRCKIKKKDIREVGTPADMAIRTEQRRQDNAERQRKVDNARRLIYESGYVVTSDKVDEILKSESLVPTENAFSSRLGKFGLDIFLLLVVDLLHEFELGVWKALLLHLIRILYTQGANVVHEFNGRFRQVPPFGRSTIRKFPHNVADLKKLAARDFEDILQCSIPCFEGLIPSPHNETIMDLLYILAYWQSLAKLRMHTDSSVEVFREVTSTLGEGLRFFTDETCRHFQTQETDGEYQARARATARKFAQSGQTGEPAVSGRRRKTFNLETSKTHALADYPDQILMFGTTDSYTTQTGEARHRTVKQWNDRTNKNNATPQIINMDVRESVHERMSAELSTLDTTTGTPTPEDAGHRTEEALSKPYHIAAVDEKNKVWLAEWTCGNQDDPAFKDFIPKLKTHLLARHRGIVYCGEEPVFDDEELNQVVFQHNRIYSHATASFNFTTYDIRREQDTINVNSDRRDVMLPSFEDDDEDGDKEIKHPYWYARVLGIYHAKVFFPGSNTPTRMEFFWVRWFGRDLSWEGGPSALRLDRIGFVPENEPEPFGFLDPALVVRACSLIPAFSFGRTTSLLSPSFARDDRMIGDWEHYYVMRFVDRDMMMRYLGLGVGHRQAADFPREHDMLRSIPEGDSYVFTDWDAQAVDEDHEDEVPESDTDSEDGDGTDGSLDSGEDEEQAGEGEDEDEDGYEY